MSNKSAKKPKELSVPRTLPEIQRHYQETCVRAGQLQYQVKVYSDELETVNEELVRINKEAAARQMLDSQAPAKDSAPVIEEAANV